MVYTKAKVFIPDVQGNVSIEVTTAQIVVPTVNLVTTYGVTNGYRISSSSGANSAYDGYCVVGADKSQGHIIPMKVGDVFRIKGAQIPTSQKTTCGIAYYDDDSGTYSGATFQYLFQGKETGLFSVSTEDDNGVVTVTILSNSGKYGIRFGFPCSDVSKLIITKNEPIT